MNHEGRQKVNNKSIENHITTSIPFDFSATEWIGNQEVNQEPSVIDMQLVAYAFRDILDWITKNGKGQARGSITRINVFMWCVDPHYFQGKPQSYVAVKLGISRSAFSRMVTSFRSRFNFHISSMRSDGTRMKNANQARGDV